MSRVSSRRLVRPPCAARGLGWLLLAGLTGCVLVGYDPDLGGASVGAPGGAGTGSAPGGDAGVGPGDAREAQDDAGRGQGSTGVGSDASPVGRDATTPDPCAGLDDGAACDDGNACTTGERCSQGICGGGSDAVTCAASLVPCTQNRCAPSSGLCETVAMPNGTVCGAGVCMSGVCSIPQQCTDPSCSFVCRSLFGCLLQCPGADSCDVACTTTCFTDCRSSGHCRATCDRGSQCLFDCQQAGNCDVQCLSSSSCAVDCRGARDCTHVVCESGASCSLRCDDGQSCAFERCDSGVVSCDANTIGCGGCPG